MITGNLTEQDYKDLLPFKHKWEIYKRTFSINLEDCANIIRRIAQSLTGIPYVASCTGCLPEALQKCFYALERYEMTLMQVTDEFNQDDIRITEIKTEELTGRVIKLPYSKKKNEKENRKTKAH